MGRNPHFCYGFVKVDWRRICVMKSLLDKWAAVCYNFIMKEREQTVNKKEKDISNSNPTYEVLKKIRNDWGQVKPYTRIEESKKHKPPKHKKKIYEED